jgi:hypothetical protein
MGFICTCNIEEGLIRRYKKKEGLIRRCHIEKVQHNNRGFNTYVIYKRYNIGFNTNIPS